MRKIEMVEKGQRYLIPGRNGEPIKVVDDPMWRISTEYGTYYIRAGSELEAVLCLKDLLESKL